MKEQLYSRIDPREASAVSDTALPPIASTPRGVEKLVNLLAAVHIPFILFKFNCYDYKYIVDYGVTFIIAK